MRFYYYVNISFLLIFICALTKIPSEEKKHITPNKKHVFFDLTNVLIKENQIGFAKEIGYGKLASYAITHWKSPGYRCLDMLDAMSNHESQKPHITITLKKRTMPRCLVELQEGTKTCSQAKEEIMQCIELLDAQKHFSSTKEKALMIAIMNLVLDPQSVAAMIEPIKATVQLVQKLKSAGHEAYIFANAPPELYATIQKKYPEMIQLFDGKVIISSQVKTVKPDLAIFNHVITTYNLNPQDCIIIDDLEETVAVAKTVGMEGIVYDKIGNVMSKLRKCGIKL